MDRDRVLDEMSEAGLTATELGPDGFLPTDPGELHEYVASHDMSVVGGFVPALLYRPDRIEDELEYVSRASSQLAATGSKVLVLGPSSHNPGYDTPFDMSDDEWPIFLANLRRLEGIVGDAGLQTALHPHWSMAIEDGHDVERLLDLSGIGLCLDTGHLYGRTNPVAVARMAPSRCSTSISRRQPARRAGTQRRGALPAGGDRRLFTPLGVVGSHRGVITPRRRLPRLTSSGRTSPAREPAPGQVGGRGQSVDFLRRLAAI
jgi:inosose dehydratase